MQNQQFIQKTIIDEGLFIFFLNTKKLTLQIFRPMKYFKINKKIMYIPLNFSKLNVNIVCEIKKQKSLLKLYNLSDSIYS